MEKNGRNYCNGKSRSEKIRYFASRKEWIKGD